MLKQEIATRLQQKINSAFSQRQRSFTVLAQAAVAEAVRSASPATPAETFTSIYHYGEKTLTELRDILSQAIIDLLYTAEFDPTDELAALLKKEANTRLGPVAHAFAHELRTGAEELGLVETMDWEHSLQQAVGVAVEEIRTAIDSHIQSRRKDMAEQIDQEDRMARSRKAAPSESTPLQCSLSKASSCLGFNMRKVNSF